MTYTICISERRSYDAGEAGRVLDKDWKELPMYAFAIVSDMTMSLFSMFESSLG